MLGKVGRQEEELSNEDGYRNLRLPCTPLFLSKDAKETIKDSIPSLKGKNQTVIPTNEKGICLSLE